MNAERLAEIRESVENVACEHFDSDTVRELLDHIAQLEAQRGGAVVVAQLDADSMHPLIDWTESYRVRMQGTADRVNAWISENSRAVDASQVLQPGMVGVDRKVFADLREGLQNILDEIQNDEDQGEGYADPVEIPCWKIREAKAAIHALSSQAGGEG